MDLQGKMDRCLCFELLEHRTLFDVIQPAEFGAVPNDGKDDRGAIQAAIDASNPGDTVRFEAGTFDIHGQLTLRSGRAYVGVAGGRDDGLNIEDLPRFLMPQTRLNISIASGYGIVTELNGHDIRVANFDIDSTQGSIGVLDGRSSNINVNHNAISSHGAHTVQMNFLKGLDLTDNFFHDSNGADRSFEGWDVSQANFNRNIMYRVNQGFHIMEPGDNVRVQFNVMRKVRRMGMEIQGKFPHRDMTLEGNVFFDAMDPWKDTFALSVPTNNGINTRIINNYLSSDFTGKWGADPAQRFGYAIETGGNGNGDASKRVVISGNVMGGPNPWFNFVVSTTADAIVENNQCYGRTRIGDFAGEPGDTGFGSVDVRENHMSSDWREMPPLPKWVDRGVIPGSEDVAVATSETSENRGIKDAVKKVSVAPPKYLSDMRWEQASSGWGPVEVNKSNGGQAAGDGKTIVLGGKRHAKGLGVAIDSSVVYDLSGKYKTFFSELGIDDRAGSKGSMTFEVWGDGRKLYDSGKLTAQGETTWTELSVKNVKKLKLVTTNANDGDNSDLGVWASAQVY